MAIKSLIINPGSTSTKVGIFEDETMIMDETLRHSTEEIAQYDSIIAQKDFRKNIILDFLKAQNQDIKSFDVVVGRGGLLKPIASGTYAVNDAMLKDIAEHKRGDHASNLGGVLAKEIGDEIGVPSFVVDPVVVDELEPVARISGVPEIERISIFHPLNQKAMGAHKKGKIVDVYGAFNGDGAFSPERANCVPALSLVELCYSGKFTEAEMKKKIIGNGGFNAYLETNDARDIIKRIDEGDEKAKLVMDAFIYNLAKNIGAMAAVMQGKVDQIIITGGIAYNERIMNKLKEYVSFIAPVTVYPGEDELLALAQGALRVMNGEEEAKIYE